MLDTEAFITTFQELRAFPNKNPVLSRRIVMLPLTFEAPLAIARILTRSAEKEVSI